MTTTHGDIEGLHDKVHILWHIPDYFSKQKADIYYNSPAFHFLGSTWSIRIYPNGQRINHTVGYVGLHVRQEKKYEEHDARFRVGIAYGDDQFLVVCSCYTSNGILYTTWDKFTERKKLISNQSLIAPEGTLTIKLLGAPSSDTGLHKGSQTKLFDGIDSLIRDFQAMLSCEQEADVTIRVKSRVFRAHKLILVARSSVFAAMFKHDMKEKITGSIDIEDCEPSAFHEFLTFIYTGEIVNLSSENVSDIFLVADKYDLSDLKQICINFMEENCVGMLCNAFYVTDKFNMVELKETVKKLFRKNKKSIMLTESWFSFIKENPKLATEIILETFS